MNAAVPNAPGRAKTLEVVAAVIIEGNRVLVAQRRPEDRFPLFWEFPGGKVEVGESHPDALRRELREELALDVEPGVLYGRSLYPLPSGANADIFFYLAERTGGDPESIEVHDWQWADAERLAALDIIPSNRELVRRLSGELGGRPEDSGRTSP